MASGMAPAWSGTCRSLKLFCPSPYVTVMTVGFTTADRYARIAASLRAKGRSACCLLGWAQETGRGVERDEKEAAMWYRRAAKQGHAPSQYALGPRRGTGARRRGRGLLGHAAAQRKLGEAYLIGEGGPFDDAEADTWFLRAAEPGRHSPSTVL